MTEICGSYMLLFVNIARFRGCCLHMIIISLNSDHIAVV